jgi:exonuclease III
LQLKINSNFYDTDAIITKFGNSNELLFISLNIQSLQSKYDSLKEFVSNLVNKNVNIAVIALQEVWSISHPDLFNIDGFKFVYKSREKGQGGGVGFYIKNELQFTIRDFIPFIDSQFESLVLETSINNKKYFLCNVYRAPAGLNDESHRDLIENFNNRLEELMNVLNMPHYNTLFFLDSNINLLKLSNSQLAAEYLDTCHANGYII